MLKIISTLPNSFPYRVGDKIKYFECLLPDICHFIKKMSQLFMRIFWVSKYDLFYHNEALTLTHFTRETPKG